MILRVDLSNVNLVTFHARVHKFLNLRIAIYAFFFKLLLGQMPEMVISRNLYYSFFHATVLCKPLVFETHQIEYGFRKGMQKLDHDKILGKTVVISNKLEEILAGRDIAAWHHTKQLCCQMRHQMVYYRQMCS